MEQFKITFRELKKYNAATRTVEVLCETLKDAERITYERFGNKKIIVLQGKDSEGEITNFGKVMTK